MFYFQKQGRPMGSKKHLQQSTLPKKKTPTFLLELPLEVEAGEAARLRGHLEAGRQFYNAVLSAGQRRLHQMRAHPPRQAAPAIPPTPPPERRAPPSPPPGRAPLLPHPPLPHPPDRRVA